MRIKLLLLMLLVCHTFYSQNTNRTDEFSLSSQRDNTAKVSAVERHRLWLNMTNPQGAFKQILVGYIQGATNGIDSDYDGVSLDANPYLDFYSLNSGISLVIQGRALPFSDLDEVLLGYRSAIEGTFTIAIDHADGMLVNHPVYLEDKYENVVHDLRLNDYTFEATIGVFKDRFVLRYKNETLENPHLEQIVSPLAIWKENEALNIHSLHHDIKKVMLYNVSGNLVYADNVAAKETAITAYSPKNEVLLMKIVLENNVVETKKIIF
jgi:hypothetical protein